MSVSSLNDPLLQALTSQTAGVSSTGTSAAARTSSTSGAGQSSADFAKLLELQMNQSMLGLSGLGADDASLPDDSSGLSSLMSSSAGDSGASMESLLMLRLLETVVDRLSALEQQVAPAAGSAAASASAYASTNAEATTADSAGTAPANTSP